MFKFLAALGLFFLFSDACAGAPSHTLSDLRATVSTVGQSDDEMQAFDVYDEITESIFESFRLYHPHECRDFFVRKARSDGKTYVDKVRRCD